MDLGPPCAPRGEHRSLEPGRMDCAGQRTSRCRTTRTEVRDGARPHLEAGGRSVWSVGRVSLRSELRRRSRCRPRVDRHTDLARPIRRSSNGGDDSAEATPPERRRSRTLVSTFSNRVRSDPTTWRAHPGSRSFDPIRISAGFASLGRNSRSVSASPGASGHSVSPVGRCLRPCMARPTGLGRRNRPSPAERTRLALAHGG